MNLIEKAKQYAIECHRSTNHLYDGHAYEFHLQSVVDIAERFIYLIDGTEGRVISLCGCWTHDVIEDTRQTYNNVWSVLNREIANIVYALTNEKGKTRKERANAKYYHVIKTTPYACFVKICDWIANMEYSFQQETNGMAYKYIQEYPDFKQHLYSDSLKPMFDYIEKLIANFDPKI